MVVFVVVSGGVGVRVGRDNVFVKGNIEDGVSGVNVDKGVVSRVVSIDGSDVEDFDVVGVGDLRSD